MHFMLINTGNDEGIGGNANENAYPPLGIISLGSELERRFGSQIRLTLADGQVDTLEEIEKQMLKVRPDTVGLSMYLTSISNTLRLARLAKSIGAQVILGNDHAIMHAKTLMVTNEDIDFICLNDVGEETIVPLFEHLMHQSPIDEVPKLLFREGGVIRKTSTPSKYRPGSSLDDIVIPNRNLLADNYWDEYSRRFSKQKRKYKTFSSDTRVTTINRARGCAQMANPCKYCGIVDLSIRYSSPEIFWQDVKAAKEQIGATVFYEAFDSASSARPVLSSWLSARPAELKEASFKFYAQAFESDQKRVNVFKDLNTFCVNMGLDSGDDRVLKLLKGEKHSLEKSKKACLLYAEAEIEVYTSFVLMGIGNERDTRDTLEATIDFAQWLAEHSSVVSFDAALFYPDRSAPIGKLIWEPDHAEEICKKLGWGFLHIDRLQEISEKWRDRVFIDSNELCADFAYVCGTNPQMLIDYSNRISEMAEAHQLNFGQSQGGKA